MEKFTFEEAFSQVNIELNRVLTGSPHIINDYLSFLSESKGKMIRAKAVLICAQEEDLSIKKGAVYAAAAIEIIHLASLVHDDVMDNADLRRGKETLQHKYGKRTAVICGDYLLSIALTLVSKIENAEKYKELKIPDYIRRLCLGELRQHINNNNIDLNSLDYFKIISGKTAALFEASFFSGSTLADCPEAEIRKYQKIGNNIGLIFQLRDDCLDFDKTGERAKKPVQSDYEQGVITLPLLHTFYKNLQLKEKAKNGSVTREEINQAVKNAGGLEYTQKVIERYRQRTLKKIDSLQAIQEKKDQIILLLNNACGL